ncbi:hypothetical protein ACRQ5Q_15115 [Bradyrhizobium sp. PMVTL-01]|uniref:phage fiber-tail adaptor protein n=1 Tax=Bradyrhizobium sp. PMVTL-01 TaxID=3434999 RepID=UPI003F6F5415
MLLWDDGKSPTEVADFDIDWTVRLAGDTIASSSWAISDGDIGAAGTLAINSSSFTTTLAKVELSGGNLGVLYTLANTVNTASGQRLVETVQLPVRSTVLRGNLTSLANAMQWLGVTKDDDGKVARMVAAVSAIIQQFLSYQVAQATYTKTFNGSGSHTLFVPDLPLVSVSSVLVNGVSVPQGRIGGGSQSVGFYNDADAIRLIGYRFMRGFQNIQTTYIAGYATVPEDIEQACLDWLKILFGSSSMPFGNNVVRVQAGDTSFDFGGSGTVTDTKKISMPQSIYFVLQPYQRVTGW